MNNLIGMKFEVSYITGINNYIPSFMTDVKSKIRIIKGTLIKVEDKEITIKHDCGDKTVILSEQIVSIKEI